MSLSTPSYSREDPIECINKAIAFLSVVASRFPPSNNQLRTSSNPRNQATIQDGRVTIQQIQGRQNQSYAGIGNRGIATTLKGNFAAGQPRVMKCYNCQGEWHIARQCTQPKRPRNVAWFKEKLMVAKAQEASQTLDEEQLTFLADPDNLDAYDSDYDDLSSAKVVLMPNLSSCDPEVLSEEIDTLKETLSNNVKEKESLSKTLTVFKTKSKEKESKYKEIVLEKQNKELENIICKMYRSMQAMHMLKKPQVFYDDTHKQALGYQNPFHLKNAQQIQPTLYDGSVIAKEHAVISVIDDEETLILEEESWSKILDKQNDPISIEKKIKISPIDYSKLNKIKEDFGKHFVTQKEWFENRLLVKTFVYELLKKKDLIEKDVYDKLLKSYSTLEKHCISLELTTQLNQEVFQKDNFRENQNAPTFNQLFELNELKAQSQEKDTVIRKLKDMIKSLSGKDSVENVKKDIDEIETINIELEHSVAKLLSENENLRKEREHLKSIYKDQFDSIRKTRVQSKEHCDSLIAQINAKNVQARLNPLSHRLENNRDAHEVYLDKNIENTNTLCGLVECARKQNPIEPLLESACMFTKHVQELLLYVSKTCLSLTKPSEKLVAVTPMNRVTSTKVVTTKETFAKLVDTPTQGILVYIRKPKATRFVGSSSNVKIVESKTSNSKESKQSWGSTIYDVPSSSLNDYRLSKLLCGTVRFGNEHIAKIIGYGDYQMRNVTISWVYYVEGLGHNLFSVGQFCDSDLEVAFHKHTCFIRDLDGVDLLKGSQGSNLYTLSMDNLLLSSPICLLSKASKTKSWLWHRRLSHLNFDYITSFAKQGLVRGLPKLKYQKDHLCSTCALGKSKKHSQKPQS
ncbi:retrovirus-related pol polyprotein from transposon TNT 1-94 [Tanacetum coccineum]